MTTEQWREWRKEHPEAQKDAKKRHRAKHPERYLARRAIHDAIRDNGFPHASDFTCACGAPAREYHHHNGYDKEHRLDVIAVCRECHRKAHRQ